MISTTTGETLRTDHSKERDKDKVVDRSAAKPSPSDERLVAVDKSRVQFDLAPKGMKLLTELKAKTEAGSYVEVIRNALKLYDGLISEVENGAVFYTKDKDGNFVPFRFFI